MEHITSFGQSGHTIRKLHLFDGVTDPTVEAMLAPCTVLRIAAHEELPNTKDTDACVYVVLRGALINFLIADNVRQRRTDKILPGESIGELSVLDQAVPSNTMTAVEDTDLLIIPSMLMWKLIDEVDGVARNLLRQLSFRLRAANAQLRRREKVGEFYRQLSMIDGLTHLYNRAWMNEKLPAMVAEAHSSGQPLALIMIDLDHFKKLNDEHGHQVGDHALRIATSILSTTIRPCDFAVRYGGEELTVILPNSDALAGKLVAQRLCENMRTAEVFENKHIPLPHITASFGIATLDAYQNTEDLITRADAALYRAKEAGRNRISL